MIQDRTLIINHSRAKALFNTAKIRTAIAFTYKRGPGPPAKGSVRCVKSRNFPKDRLSWKKLTKRSEDNKQARATASTSKTSILEASLKQGTKGTVENDAFFDVLRCLVTQALQMRER